MTCLECSLLGIDPVATGDRQVASCEEDFCCNQYEENPAHLLTYCGVPKSLRNGLHLD